MGLVAGLLLGIGITIIPAGVMPVAPAPLDAGLVTTAVGGGLFTVFAMGMDFPRSTLRFSRLSG